MSKTFLKISILIVFSQFSCSKNNQTTSTDFLDDKMPDYFNSQVDTFKFYSFAKYNSLLDIEGNKYRIIELGRQTWMAENLRTRKFKNGDKIKLGQAEKDWFPTVEPRYCVVDHLNDIYTSNNGRIYNYYSVQDNRGLCPEGWRIPTINDFIELHKFSDSIAKSYASNPKPTVQTLLYRNSFHAGVNYLGLTLDKGGWREENGKNGKGQLYYELSLWTKNKANNSLGKYLKNMNTNFDSTNTYFIDTSRLNEGHSIRCIKN